MRAARSRAAWVVAALVLTVPALALGAADPSPATKSGLSINGIAAECPGTVAAVGATDKTTMLVQRFAADGSAGAVFNAGTGVAHGVAVQPDGKIVVGGSDKVNGQNAMVVKRFNADGSPDGGFGAGGTVTIPAATVANSVAIGPGGTIVAGGSAPDPKDAFARVALVRLLPNGSPDAGFGTNGLSVIDLGPLSQAKSIAVQGDGKVVFAGEQIPDLQVANALIGRANTNGSLDTGFATNGTFLYLHPNGGANSTFDGVALDDQGRILAAGADRTGGNSQAVFARLTSGGQLDGTFQGGGLFTTQASKGYNGGDAIGAHAIAVAGGGRIVATGSFQDSGQAYASLWVMNANGVLDGSIGVGGRVDTQPNFDGGIGHGIAITPDGSILVGGDAINLIGTNQGFVGRYSGFGARPLAGCPAPAPPPPPPPVAKPKLTKVSLSPKTLRKTTKAKLRFTLDRAVSVKLTVEQKRSGRKQGKSCKKPSSKNRKGKKCTYFTTVAARTIAGKTGANTVTVQRRFASKTLKKGSYRLTVAATGGNSTKLNFSVK